MSILPVSVRQSVTRESPSPLLCEQCFWLRSRDSGVSKCGVLQVQYREGGGLGGMTLITSVVGKGGGNMKEGEQYSSEISDFAAPVHAVY